ncbi:hypothetical protein FA195_16610 [Pseudomonas aeruginosa]|nr:hypothetical protein [Pseudomonas aeruginosa]
MKHCLALAALIFSGYALAAPKNAAIKPWIQEPDSFMGINFDQRLEHSLPQCPSGYEPPKSMCRGAPYQGLYTIEGTPSIGLIGGYGLSAMAKTGPVDWFYLTAQVDDFPRLTQIFITKYGQPTTRSTETVKTKGGAEFTNENLQWVGKKVEITLLKYDGDINTSSATLRTVASKDRAARDGGKKIQDAASKL